MVGGGIGTYWHPGQMSQAEHDSPALPLSPKGCKGVYIYLNICIYTAPFTPTLSGFAESGLLLSLEPFLIDQES